MSEDQFAYSAPKRCYGSKVSQFCTIIGQDKDAHLDKRECTVNTGGDATGRPDVAVHNPTSLSIQERLVFIHPQEANRKHLRYPVYIWTSGLDPRKGGLVRGRTASVEDTSARENRCTSTDRQYIPK